MSVYDHISAWETEHYRANVLDEIAVELNAMSSAAMRELFGEHLQKNLYLQWVVPIAVRRMPLFTLEEARTWPKKGWELIDLVRAKYNIAVNRETRAAALARLRPRPTRRTVKASM